MNRRKAQAVGDDLAQLGFILREMPPPVPPSVKAGRTITG
jgi:hypothetical protein